MDDASRELEALRADARYARERYELYRAKSYGMHATSPVRLRDLERRATETRERLEFALRQARERAEPPRGD